METINESNPSEAAPEREGYVPRPGWQVWSARIGLVLFLLLVAAQIVNIARGGL